MTKDLGFFCCTPKAELHAAGSDFCSPGYWVALIAQAKAEGVPFESLALTHDQDGYLRAMHAPEVLGEKDTYPYANHKKGINYSPFVSLNNANVVDAATSAMNGCIQSLVGNELKNGFVKDLCDVVGDLHDNVWAHAESPGVSLAQKWNDPRSDRSEQIIEFALADCGRGFLRELLRVGLAQRLGIEDHQSAIAWCIAEGNSSKRIAADDGWIQRLPPDHMGNPMGPYAGVTSPNHHLGLGLAKLIRCVRTYQGHLWIASGTQHLRISPGRTDSYITNIRPWQGVAMACRFETVRLRSISATPADPTVSLIEAVISRESRS